MMEPTPAALEDLEHDPRYRRLVHRRSRFAWALTALMLVIYFGFILMVAFGRSFLSQPIAGGATTVGIPLGLGVIAAAIVLTAYYVSRANAEFDHDVEALAAEHRA